jgi:NAD+ synthase
MKLKAKPEGGGRRAEGQNASGSQLSTLNSQLSINGPLVEKMLCGFIETELHRAGFRRVVLGVSGGIDSSLVAVLAARALGPQNVCGVRMPYKTSSEETMRHSQQVIDLLGIDSLTIPITDAIDAYFARFPDASSLRRANKMARERMTTLYDQSAAQNALVLGTSNKSELLLGYGTQFGDMASALNPIGDLYKTQVRQLSQYLGVPDEIIAKNPTGDLWIGQTDEGELGFTYEMVDRLLVLLVDLRYRKRELVSAGFDPAFVDRVSGLVQRSHYKRRLPVIAKISTRTVDRDFRYARDWGT